MAKSTPILRIHQWRYPRICHFDIIFEIIADHYLIFCHVVYATKGITIIATVKSRLTPQQISTLVIDLMQKACTSFEVKVKPFLDFSMQGRLWRRRVIIRQVMRFERVRKGAIGHLSFTVQPIYRLFPNQFSNTNMPTHPDQIGTIPKVVRHTPIPYENGIIIIKHFLRECY